MKVSAEMATGSGSGLPYHHYCYAFFACVACASLLTVGASPVPAGHSAPLGGDARSSEKVRLCGHKLKNEIMAICRGGLPGSLSLRSPFNSPAANEQRSNSSSFLMKPAIRVTRSVIEECCRKPCDPRALFKYCSHPVRSAGSRLTREPQPTTTTTSPTNLLHRSPRTEKMEPYTHRSNLLLIPRRSEGENPSATIVRPGSGLFFSSSQSRDSFFTLSDRSSSTGSSTTRGYRSSLSNGNFQQQHHYRLRPSMFSSSSSSSSSSPHFSVEKYYPPSNGIRAGDEKEEESVDTTNGYSIDDSQVTKQGWDREQDDRFRNPSESRSVTDSDFGEVFAIPAGTHGELY